MKVLRKRKVAEEYLYEVFCNRCGGSCTVFHKSSKGPLVPEHCGLIEAQVNGEYSSKHLQDMTTYYFSLCEACLVDLFGTFKIPPGQFRVIDDTWEKPDRRKK